MIGYTRCCTIDLTAHVTSLLKQCSQRVYLLRLLRSQGMSSNHLNTIFHAIIVSRILYALLAWGVFMSAAQSGRIDAYLMRAHKCGFSKELLTVNELLYLVELCLKR